MRAVVQRVRTASVTVDGVLVASIPAGLLVLVGATHSDTSALAQTLARKTANLRILRPGVADGPGADAPRAPDDAAVSALDVGAPILVVSQFTLYADTRRGRRPSWGDAAPAAVAEPLVEAFASELARLGVPVRTGRFGADMAVASVNDGPVTVILDT